MWVGTIQSTEGLESTRRQRKIIFFPLSLFWSWNTRLILPISSFWTPRFSPVALLVVRHSDLDWVMLLASLVLQLAHRISWDFSDSIIVWDSSNKSSLLSLSFCSYRCRYSYWFCFSVEPWLIQASSKFFILVIILFKPQIFILFF